MSDPRLDLVVVVKPAPEKLPEINDELANWILVDPVRLTMPASKALLHPVIHAQKVKRLQVRVDKEDVLLAVIHGFESKGWRGSAGYPDLRAEGCR